MLLTLGFVSCIKYIGDEVTYVVTCKFRLLVMRTQCRDTSYSRQSGKHIQSGYDTTFLPW